MNILGVGPAEIILIFIILFVFAGPKRMVAWSYQLGVYVQKFRAMFDETMSAVRKEFEEAQIDLPKDIGVGLPKRFDIVQEANKLINTELGKPVGAPSSAPAETTAKLPEPAKPENSAPAAPESSPAQTNPDEEKPRYDAWLPK